MLSGCQCTADIWYIAKAIPCPLIGYYPAVMSSWLAYKKADRLSCFKGASVLETWKCLYMCGNRNRERDRARACVFVCACQSHTNSWNWQLSKKWRGSCWQTLYYESLCGGFKSFWSMKSLDWRRGQSLEVTIKEHLKIKVCFTKCKSCRQPICHGWKHHSLWFIWTYQSSEINIDLK